MKECHRFSVVSGVLLLLVIVLSVVVYRLQDQYLEYVLFFPTGREAEIAGEGRKIPKKGNTEERIGDYCKELILGPMDISLNRLLPRDTELISFIVRKGKLYCNFSSSLLFPENEVPLSFYEMIDSFIYGISFNFPEIEEVVVMVNGQIPQDY